MSPPEPHRAIETVFRVESARLIAGLTRIVCDVGTAEELAQDALVAALEQWPEAGIPKNPGAWLMSVAKNRAIDRVRSERRHRDKEDAIGRAHGDAQPDAVDELDARLDDDVGDDLLRLVFVSCHPVLSREARVALTLRLMGGLSTDEIARAFVVSEPTIAQRIVRAKRVLSEARVPFEVPRAEERAERLSSVLEVVYLIFNEGYAATAGDDWLRPALCEDALRLGRILAGLTPDEAEVHGLVALMEIQASRARARVTPDGTPVLLLEQNRAQWDWLLIDRGLTALAKAESLAAPRGPYTLQAAIAACHARARAPGDTDWNRIVTIYDELLRGVPSPIVALNRAVAVSMAHGPATGLALVDALREEPSLTGYHLLHGVRGDLLEKVGRYDEARRELEHAASLTRNAPERKLLLERAAMCARQST